MNNQTSMLSLIAVMVAAFSLPPLEAQADHPWRNILVNRSSKKCSVVGCGSIGKCGRCRKEAALEASRLQQPSPISISKNELSVGIGDISHPEDCGCLEHRNRRVDSMSLASVIVREPDLDLVSCDMDLPSCGAPAPVAPTPSCGPGGCDSAGACDDPGSFGTSCDDGYTPGQLYSDYSYGTTKTRRTCGGCGSSSCGGSCKLLSRTSKRSCGCGDAGCAGSCDDMPSSGLGGLSSQCDCGAVVCDGSCCGSTGVEMTFAERLWANACCEPYRTGYCAVFGGFNEVDDLYVTDTTPVLGSFEDSWIAGISKGRYVTRCLRAEFEYSYRESAGERLTVAGTPYDLEGDLDVHTLMFNTVFELNNRGPLSYISPYFGAGIGLARFDGELMSTGLDIEVDDTKLAWQGIFGVNMALSQAIDLFGEYRILWTSEVDVHNAMTGASLGMTDPEFDTYLVGLRFYH